MFRRRRKVQCETCGRLVPATKAVQITASAPIRSEWGVGGGSVTATYCKNDAPKEAAA